MRLSLWAVIWTGLFLLLAAAPLVVLLLGEMPFGREFWWDFSMALGFAGMAMMGAQFALTARFRRASAPFGIDVLYYFHRYFAIFALGVVLSHFAILWFLYPAELGELDPRVARWELTAGRAALVLFALAVITSQWRTQLRLEYGLWRYSHVLLATLGLVAAAAHISGVGYYTASPYKRTLWLALALFWLLLVIWVRFVKPWVQKRRPYQVVDISEHSARSWTLAIEPVGHAGLAAFKPGQFAWLTLRASPYALREHPFSICSAPEQLPRLEFGIKELGDFTGTIGALKAGETVYIDGPYGIFSYENHPDAAGFVFIVGGIGITPILSMLRSMTHRQEKRPVWLFYGNASLQEIAYRDEVDGAAATLNLQVIHVLQDAAEDWSGETGFIDRDILERHLPADLPAAGLRYFLCGPKPMLEATEKALRGMGVSLRHIQSEIFELV